MRLDARVARLEQRPRPPCLDCPPPLLRWAHLLTDADLAVRCVTCGRPRDVYAGNVTATGQYSRRVTP